MGIEASGLDNLITASYDLLGLISFLTDGKKECRAWTIRKGTKAPQAAGKIHSDFERGFIRASVIGYSDLEANNFDYAAVKAKGLQRTEGKEYVVKDGDVIEFLFNVYNLSVSLPFDSSPVRGAYQKRIKIMIIGIMGAMPDEVDQLCAKLENVTVEPYGGVEYHKGTLAGKQVVVCCAGMGKANAAATTQVLITKFGAEKIIFSGIAGNMTSKIGIGDVVIGKTVLYHDAQLDMICQNPPFLKEYTGDPALIAAAEKACADCRRQRLWRARSPPATCSWATAPPKPPLRPSAPPTAWRWRARP